MSEDILSPDGVKVNQSAEPGPDSEKKNVNTSKRKFLKTLFHFTVGSAVVAASPLVVTDEGRNSVVASRERVEVTSQAPFTLSTEDKHSLWEKQFGEGDKIFTEKQWDSLISSIEPVVSAFYVNKKKENQPYNEFFDNFLTTAKGYCEILDLDYHLFFDRICNSPFARPDYLTDLKVSQIQMISGAYGHATGESAFVKNEFLKLMSPFEVIRVDGNITLGIFDMESLQVVEAFKRVDPKMFDGLLAKGHPVWEAYSSLWKSRVEYDAERKRVVEAIDSHLEHFPETTSVFWGENSKEAFSEIGVKKPLSSWLKTNVGQVWNAYIELGVSPEVGYNNPDIDQLVTEKAINTYSGHPQREKLLFMDQFMNPKFLAFLELRAQASGNAEELQSLKNLSALRKKHTDLSDKCISMDRVAVARAGEQELSVDFQLATAAVLVKDWSMRADMALSKFDKFDPQNKNSVLFNLHNLICIREVSNAEQMTHIPLWTRADMPYNPELVLDRIKSLYTKLGFNPAEDFERTLGVLRSLRNNINPTIDGRPLYSDEKFIEVCNYYLEDVLGKPISGAYYALDACEKFYNK